MRFGYFDDQHREYVITRPDTPLPWINYLGCEDYIGLISNTAGGYSFYKDARLRRLTRYRYNNVPLDTGGRYLYLRDDDALSDSSSPLFWSPTWQPTRQPLDEYECRHGLGYTIIRSSLAQINAEIRYFVPPGQNLEIWELTLTNNRQKDAHLSIFSAIEFCLWDALDDATNFQRNYSIGEVEVSEDVIYHKSEYRERRNHFAFFACSERLVGFDTRREAFFGAYRGWENPAAVESGHLSNSIACGWQPFGSHHIKLSLRSGEQKKVTFLLGYHENPEDDKFDPPGSQNINRREVKNIITHYLDPSIGEKAFQELQKYWDNLLNKMQVSTPDIHTNRMVNIWNAYQVMTTFNLSRSASYFESGIGRGIGFRDSNQDLLGFVQLVPQRARQRIIDLASTQMQNGGAYHQYQPLTKQGNNAVGTNFNDDPLWLILAVAAYIKETGDWDILDDSMPFDSTPGTEASLFEHLKRSIHYVLDRIGPHGLPLIGRADWNDCLNLNCFSDFPGQSFQTTTNKNGKIAESVFIAGLFVLAAEELINIANHQGYTQDSVDLQTAVTAMKTKIWESGWDGEWFLRAYDDFGKPLGSKSCAEGQIFIEPQGICVMAGLGLENGYARQALDSVAQKLATHQGITLHQPAFTRYYLHLGEISSYPPGYKENSGVFCHTNPWIMIAETKIGRSDKAHDYYLRINPSAREGMSEIHKCEPYVYAQMIAGLDAQVPGEAKNSWLTGTAAWNYVAITQYILGIRPTFDGLEVAPVMPPDWQGFDANRFYRGVEYHIHVDRIGEGNQVSLEIDGRPIKSSIIPLPPAGIKHLYVTVQVGSR
ncbi:MAG: glycosyl transferase [Anaerolineales bacterium]|nr:glycosyl transferase [Anaerolineales bacterium]